MPNRWPIANGNWSDAAIWSGSIIPTASDDVYANSKSVIIDQNVIVNSFRSSIISGVAQGGQFIISGSYVVSASSLISNGFDSVNVTGLIGLTGSSLNNATVIITSVTNTFYAFSAGFIVSSEIGATSNSSGIVSVCLIGSNNWSASGNCYGRVVQVPNSSGTVSTLNSLSMGGINNFSLTANTDNAAADVFDGTIEINHYASTSGKRKKINTNFLSFQNGYYTANLGSYVYYSSTTAISSLTFEVNTGTFSGGTVLVYGVN